MSKVTTSTESIATNFQEAQPIAETKFIAEGFSHYLTFEVDSQGKVSAFNFVGLMAQRYFKK